MKLLGCLKCLLPWGKYSEVPVDPLPANIEFSKKSGGFIDSRRFPTVVVVPDVHGDLDGAILSVWNAYALLEREAAGGRVVDQAEFEGLFRKYLKNPKMKIKPMSALRDVALVQLGDFIDRGPDSELCVRFFLAIPAVLGWPVWGLLGNHEIASMSMPTMTDENRKDKKNLVNSYVHPDDWQAYDESDPRVRDRAYGWFEDKALAGKCNRPKGMWKRMFGKVSTDCVMWNLLTDNMYGVVRWAPQAEPLDMLEHSPGSAATLFVHGGVAMDWFHDLMGGDDLDTFDTASVNAKIKASTKTMRGETESPAPMAANSVFNDRKTVLAPTRALCTDLLPVILRAFDVSRIIVGHTPQENAKANTRCNGQLVLADARISRWMRGETVESPLNPYAVILKSEREGGTVLKSMIALSNRPSKQSVESLFDREFFFASTQFTPLPTGRVVPGLVMHTRVPRSDTSREVREYVVGNVVGVGVSAGMADVAETVRLFFRQNGVQVLSDGSGAIVTFVPRKCMGLVSMEISHLLGRINAGVKESFRDTVLDPVVEIFKLAHSSGLQLGLAPGQLFDSFCVGEFGEVFLADYTGVKLASDPKELEEERERFELEKKRVIFEIKKGLDPRRK